MHMKSTFFCLCLIAIGSVQAIGQEPSEDKIDIRAKYKMEIGWGNHYLWCDKPNHNFISSGIEFHTGAGVEWLNFELMFRYGYSQPNIVIWDGTLNDFSYGNTHTFSGDLGYNVKLFKMMCLTPYVGMGSSQGAYYFNQVFASNEERFFQMETVGMWRAGLRLDVYVNENIGVGGFLNMSGSDDYFGEQYGVSLRLKNLFLTEGH